MISHNNGHMKYKSNLLTHYNLFLYYQRDLLALLFFLKSLRLILPITTKRSFLFNSKNIKLLKIVFIPRIWLLIIWQDLYLSFLCVLSIFSDNILLKLNIYLFIFKLLYRRVQYSHRLILTEIIYVLSIWL